MTTPSTLDRIRKLIEQTRSDLERFADDITIMSPASRISPQHRLADLREALRLLDSLAPATPPRNPIDALRVALDYGTEREWPLDLRELVARLLPEMRVASKWCVSEGDLTAIRYAADDRHVVVRVARENQRWRVMYPRDAGPFLSMEDAQAAGDQMVEGEWALCGGAVRPTNGTNGTNGTNARVGIPAESEWAPPPQAPRNDAPADTVVCHACGGSGLQTRGVVVSLCSVCGGARRVPGVEPGTPPEEGQPDASWLRHIRPADGDVRLGWVYEGETALQLAANPSGVIPLLPWLAARNLLVEELEYTDRDGSPWVRIVTRAPLDGDWCAACGENMDGARFLASRQRIVRGEEATVCGSCAEDSDGGWP